MYYINLQHKCDRRGLCLFQRQHLLWYQRFPRREALLRLHSAQRDDSRNQKKKRNNHQCLNRETRE